MDRLEEIRQHCEGGGPIRRIDMKYLLSEVDRLTALHKREIIVTGEYAQRVIDLTARAEAAEARADAAVEDMTKLATKPITPCHSCSKTCLFPASLAPGLQPATWCRDWQWHGPQNEKGE